VSPQRQRRRGPDQGHRDAAEGHEDRSSRRRAFKPRPALAVVPLAVSTETCFELAGIRPRKLREALAVHPDVPRSRLGHTTIVTAEAFATLLERLSVDDVGAPEASSDETADDEPTCAQLLSRVGRVRAAGGGR
jgi:hypothetical protein